MTYRCNSCQSFFSEPVLFTEQDAQDAVAEAEVDPSFLEDPEAVLDHIEGLINSEICPVCQSSEIEQM